MADPAPAAFKQLRSIHSSASESKQHPTINSVGGASSTKNRQKQPAHHLESEGYPGVSKQPLLGQGTGSSPPDLRAAGPTTSWREENPPATGLSHGWG